jgi:ABC-2 type transport system permease protein
VVVLPQVLLCGLFQPRDQMATVLRWASDVLPVPYAVEALQHVADNRIDGAFTRDLLVLVAFVAGSVVAAAATLRRTSP